MQNLKQKKKRRRRKKLRSARRHVQKARRILMITPRRSKRLTLIPMNMSIRTKSQRASRRLRLRQLHALSSTTKRRRRLCKKSIIMQPSKRRSSWLMSAKSGNRYWLKTARNATMPWRKLARRLNLSVSKKKSAELNSTPLISKSIARWFWRRPKTKQLMRLDGKPQRSRLMRRGASRRFSRSERQSIKLESLLRLRLNTARKSSLPENRPKRLLKQS